MNAFLCQYETGNAYLVYEGTQTVISNSEFEILRRIPVNLRVEALKTMRGGEVRHACRG